MKLVQKLYCSHEFNFFFLNDNGNFITTKQKTSQVRYKEQDLQKQKQAHHTGPNQRNTKGLSKIKNDPPP
ncbi:hypothetical protein L6452_11146 [Arctium lappa]|uniref:Uncharacterized protein n=1 Tax=Arctium lappa TaxID=4217 RepID=A0ACB9DNE3_ARCLA|nr:hypothetical protein L6452_11146 [Arctium lappa]